MKKLIICLIVVIPICIIFPRLFLKLLSLAGIVIMLLSIAVMLLTYRRARKLSPWPLIISFLMSIICYVVYAALLKASLSATINFVSLSAGCMAGTVQAFTNSLFIDNNTIQTRRNIWYLAAWGGTLALNQIITLITGRPPEIAMILLAFATGLAMGNSAILLGRLYQFKSLHRRQQT